MRRQLVLMLVCATGVAALLGAWPRSGRDAENSAGALDDPPWHYQTELLPLPEPPGAELLWSWAAAAKTKALPPTQILFKPDEVIALMNDRPVSAGDFLGRFVLWERGDPVPPGYQENPHPKDWTPDDRELDQLRAAPEWWDFEVPDDPRFFKKRPSVTYAPRVRLNVPRRNTLHEQTSLYLVLYSYRMRVIDGTAYVFREDALIPPLITRKLYVCDPIDAPAYRKNFGSAVLPDGRVDIQRALEDWPGILFLPGASAIVDPDDGTMTLRLDQSDMNAALRYLDSRRYLGDGRGGTITDSRAARWWWGVKRGARQTGEYLKIRFAP